MRNYTVFLLFLTLANTLISQAYDQRRISRVLREIMDRRRSHQNSILARPRFPEDLPEAEPVMPGHTLLRPSRGMLKSAVKYPQKDLSTLVYGNLDNLGITYGKTPYRVLYTGFRKSYSQNNVGTALLQAIRNIIMDQSRHELEPEVIILETKSSDFKRDYQLMKEVFKRAGLIKESDQELNAILNESSEEEGGDDYRRHHSHRKYRDRSKFYRIHSSSSSSSSSDSSSSDSSSDDDSDYDRNPGNPYTLYKGKYKQNYMWHHAMDGDHMNINPFGPSFAPSGPSAVDLFFGRKWWYFNQDDYKPLNK